MKNLFEVTTLNEMKSRLARLNPDSNRQWGKMSAAQMLAHCSEWMEMAARQTSPPRNWLGYIFGGLAKRSILSDAPIRRNMPTERSLIVNDERDFASEQQRLALYMDRFTRLAVPNYAGSIRTAFFGPMTPEEWATLGYKHLDHHFRQFGV
ncbi:MAG: DUF1569 domain-containing protein [Ignavibacteriota bacterium]